MKNLSVPSLAASALALAVLSAGMFPSTARAEEPSAPPAPAAAPDPLELARKRVREIQGNLVSALAKVRRSSVTVFCKVTPKPKPQAPGASPEGGPPPEPVLVSGGLGVVIKFGGKSWVITNQHVVAGAEIVSVIDSKGKEHAVQVHDAVEQQDIALLSFDSRKVDVDPVIIRKQASKKLVEGMWVLATGNPFFLAKDGRSVATLGVVSGLDRVLGGRFTYGRAIQHDAEVNKGNSGGPLWNLSGELVGINGMIIVREQNAAGLPVSSGVSFAIPIDQVWGHLSTLVDKRKDAKAPFLGLTTSTVTDKKGKPIGARIDGMDRRSPCARKNGSSKGLIAGDVIRYFTPAGKRYKINTKKDLTNALMQCKAGVKVSIRVRRGRREFTWSGKLGTRD